jgi:hypothetical protein
MWLHAIQTAARSIYESKGIPPRPAEIPKEIQDSFDTTCQGMAKVRIKGPLLVLQFNPEREAAFRKEMEEAEIIHNRIDRGLNGTPRTPDAVIVDCHLLRTKAVELEAELEVLDISEPAAVPVAAQTTQGHPGQAPVVKLDVKQETHVSSSPRQLTATQSAIAPPPGAEQQPAAAGSRKPSFLNVLTPIVTRRSFWIAVIGIVVLGALVVVAVGTGNLKFLVWPFQVVGRVFAKVFGVSPDSLPPPPILK